MVRPDEVSLEVLVSVVSRDAVDAAVAVCGVGDKRSGGKLPGACHGVSDDGDVPVRRR